MWKPMLLMVMVGVSCKDPIDVDQVAGQTTCRALYKPYIVNRNLFAAVELRIRDAIYLRERATLWAAKKVTAREDFLAQFSEAARSADYVGGSARSLCEMAIALHESMLDIASIIPERGFQNYGKTPSSLDCPAAAEVSVVPDRAMKKWKDLHAQIQPVESEYIERCNSRFGVREPLLPPTVFATAGFERSADDILARLRVK